MPNYIKNAYKSTSYVASLSIHVVLLTMMGFYFEFSSHAVVLGNAESAAVQSYFAAEPSRPKAVPHDEPRSAVVKSGPLQKVKPRLHEPDPTRAVTSTTSNSRGEQTEALLALLHDAIQKQQHYPASALEMERQGRVTVSFTLFTNGAIRDLRIVKSSGTNSLDNAALLAVNAAAPFKQINHYLNDSREFAIDIVFELA